MRSMTPAKRTILVELQFTGSILLIFGRRIIPTLAGTTCKGNYISHLFTSCLRNNYPTPFESGAICYVFSGS